MLRSETEDTGENCRCRCDDGSEKTGCGMSGRKGRVGMVVCGRGYRANLTEMNCCLPVSQSYLQSGIYSLLSNPTHDTSRIGLSN